MAPRRLEAAHPMNRDSPPRASTTLNAMHAASGMEARRAALGAAQGTALACQWTMVHVKSSDWRLCAPGQQPTVCSPMNACRLLSLDHIQHQRQQGSVLRSVGADSVTRQTTHCPPTMERHGRKAEQQHMGKHARCPMQAAAQEQKKRGPLPIPGNAMRCSAPPRAHK